MADIGTNELVASNVFEAGHGDKFDENLDKTQVNLTDQCLPAPRGSAAPARQVLPCDDGVVGRVEVEAAAALALLVPASAADGLPDLDEGARPLVVSQQVLPGLTVQGGRQAGRRRIKISGFMTWRLGWGDMNAEFSTDYPILARLT